MGKISCHRHLANMRYVVLSSKINIVFKGKTFNNLFLLLDATQLR